MKRSLAMVYVVGLFVLGVLIGATGMHLYDVRHPPMPPPRGLGMSELRIDQLDRLLELTPEQREQIHTILRESREEARVIHETLAPRVRDQLRQTRERLVEVLTAEQRAKLDELTRFERGRFERFLMRPPHDDEDAPQRRRPRRRPPREGP